MPRDKKEARRMWKSGRATVKNDQQSVSPWTPKAQAAIVAAFALMVAIYVLMLACGIGA